MTDINRAYGILRGAVQITQDIPGFRYSNVSPSAAQKEKLSGLLSEDVHTRALQIDGLLRLLQCSPYWPDFVRKYDSNNTYDVPCVLLSDTDTFKNMIGEGPVVRLLKWAASRPTAAGDFACHGHTPELDAACAKLMEALI